MAEGSGGGRRQQLAAAVWRHPAPAAVPFRELGAGRM